MPNHVENDLYLTGPADEVEALLKRIKADENKFDFCTIIPYPKIYADLDEESRTLGYQEFRKKYGPDAKDGFNSGGYEWCVQNWGTKWNAYHVEVSEGKITFQTAWSPPLPVIRELHRQFPHVTLELEYFERGMGFCGGVTYRNLPRSTRRLNPNQ